jgi:hypothetical protein
MYIELSADNPTVIHRAVAEAVQEMTSDETLRATIQRGREPGLWRLELSSITGEDDAPLSEA